MKKTGLIAVLLAAVLVLGLCGCGEEKAIPEYNGPMAGREVDKTDVDAVIKNALFVDVYDKISFSEAVASEYDVYSKEQKGKKLTYHVVASVGGYVYENNKLTRVYGTSAFPAIIKLKEKNGEYEVTGFTAGVGFETEEELELFITDNFPKNTNAEEVMKGKSKLLFDREKQQICEFYNIDESEFVSGDEVIEILPVSNEAYYAVSDYFEFYPDWLGTRSAVEEGVRYIYSTAFEETAPGVGTLSFVKTNEAGEEIERIDIKVDGDYVEFPEDIEAVEGEPVVEEPIEEEPVEEEPIETETPKVRPDPEGETTYTPEELEEIEKEFDYDDGIEYTLVD